MGISPEVKEGCTIVDDVHLLPFMLSLTIGVGFNQKKERITGLTRNPQRILECVTEIEELKNLSITMMSESAADVEIIWNKVYKHNDADVEASFTLRNDITKVLYEHGKEKDEDYPWSCGVYHFEVIYKGHSYYGAFKIMPKNLDDGQYEKMHEMINSHLKGLGMNHVVYDRKPFEESIQMRMRAEAYASWFCAVAGKLLSNLRAIEQDSLLSLKRGYKPERKEGVTDSRSIRWTYTTKGIALGETYSYNRKTGIFHDTEENRLVKSLLRKMIQQLGGTVTAMIPDEKSSQGQQEERIRDAQRVKALLFSPFWRDVQDGPAGGMPGSMRGNYSVFHHLFREGAEVLKRFEGELAVPVHKPTSVLYEYYVFFGLYSIMQEIGFRTGEYSLYEQLYQSFYKEGLKPGTKITLYGREVRIDLVYDEEIASSPEKAAEQSGGFYSFRPKRRPDIRADFYRHTAEGGLQYLSSCIFEVKYSPFSNIYRSTGMANAMEQMEDYRMIKYVSKNGAFRFSPIKEVFCIYPGNAYRPILSAMSCGYYLQIAPDAKEEDPDLFRGRAELKKIIVDWLAEYS